MNNSSPCEALDTAFYSDADGDYCTMLEISFRPVESLLAYPLA